MHRMFSASSVIFLFILFPFMVFGGGIKGKVTTEQGEPLAWATIYIQQTSSAVLSAEDGTFEINLPPGTYDLAFQFIGYESKKIQVKVDEAFQEIHVTLLEQAIILREVTVRAKDEDPAYTVMRKAISKAQYQRQYIDEYKTTAYIKGKGKLDNIPWLLKKELAKDGVQEGRLYIRESVNEFSYKRPGQVNEKVIAQYQTMGEDMEDAVPFVFGDFYAPKVFNAISPLSPIAMAHYKFEYMGTIVEGDYTINKIRVVPRSKGDQVFTGVMFIIEDLWSIHSLDLSATNRGVQIRFQILYRPIRENVWLPVSQTIFGSGKVMGFEFSGEYLSTMKDYEVTLNPDLPQYVEVVDEKLLKKIDLPNDSKINLASVDEKLTTGKPVTRKELRKYVKNYQKEEQKKKSDSDIVYDRNITVDSLALKKDSLFWQAARPAKLTSEEFRGYLVADSIMNAQERKAKGDTLKPSKNKGFQPLDLLLGDQYPVNPTTNFSIHRINGGLNTVEGFYLAYQTSLSKRWLEKNDSTKTKSSWYISPTIRYAFSRKVLSGKLTTSWQNSKTKISLEGGRYVSQFNSDVPIRPLINSAYTLFVGENYMKLYERRYFDIGYENKLSSRYKLSWHSSWAQRYELFNATNFFSPFYSREKYTHNAPISYELWNTAFLMHRAWLMTFSFEARPWLKFYKINKKKNSIETSSPTFNLTYQGGFDGFGSQVRYDHINLKISHNIRLGISSTLKLAGQVGGFLNADKLYFPDYKHFMGNQTHLLSKEFLGTYRLLPYYDYSTKKEYASLHGNYNFRKFFLSQLFWIRRKGMSEELFINSLHLPGFKPYVETGYALTGIFRIIRVEAVAAFKGSSYHTFGIRVGISNSISF